ncbi:MAG TPA: hypothetical protein VFS94_12570 [Gemmatimonadales bacterium]|nr:hypothetical protein [Gemmatimonadales bacterium]
MSLAALGTLCVEGVVLGAALVAVHGCGDESNAGSTAPDVPVLAITESVTVSGGAQLGDIVALAVGPDGEAGSLIPATHSERCRRRRHVPSSGSQPRGRSLRSG